MELESLVDVGEPIKVGGVPYSICWHRMDYGWHAEAATGGVVIVAVDVPFERECKILSSVLRVLARRNGAR